MSTFASQSVTVDELLDAVFALLQAATGFTDRQIIEWHSDQQYKLDNSGGRGSLIWFRYLSMTPNINSGASRYGFKTDFVVEVNLITRSNADGTQTDKLLGRKHIGLVARIVNATMGRMLFDSYAAYDAETNGLEPPMTTYTVAMTWQQRQDRAGGVEGAVPRVLSVAEMASAELPPYQHNMPAEGRIQTRLSISIPVVLRLTLNDSVALEE